MITMRDIEHHLQRMDITAWMQRVQDGLIWGARCRCEVCERLRAVGKPGLDGVGPTERQRLA